MVASEGADSGAASGVERAEDAQHAPHEIEANVFDPVLVADSGFKCAGAGRTVEANDSPDMGMGGFGRGSSVLGRRGRPGRRFEAGVGGWVVRRPRGGARGATGTGGGADWRSGCLARGIAGQVRIEGG
ncbi:MAG: hypothetical protein OZSIB_0961 [Candidatus Ozemobacter sibiricus]|uniref:Uncharacterized protein n=1 Tax=Candidatus Ozemobacter sibiricus TaxID=2268124 RepID=A0A367ZNA0_9BACT|nr:MAG: hypothetical protein OZSIB_0961 [Candidatus Ozemobacter sibiricus]